MFELTQVENLNGDLTSIKARLDECRAAAKEITETVRNRIISDKENAERRAKELQAEIQSGTCSDTINRIKQKEIDAIANRKYGPTDDERAEFQETISEYRTANEDLKRKQIELREAIRVAKHRLDELKSNMYSGADPDLIKSWINGDIEEFEKLSTFLEV